MNQISTAPWSKSQLILFRFTFCYFVLFFLFLNHIFPTRLLGFLDFINVPFRFIRNSFISWIGKIFLAKELEPDAGWDSQFGYVAVTTFFILSVIITLIWSALDKRKNYNNLYKYLHTYGRYYLAFILFNYGCGKLFGVQFRPLSPSSYITPLSDWTPRELLWRFMGASRSYNYFGGLLEVIGGGLLLFRKTSTIGALLTIATLLNVLMLNIGYVVFVKLWAFHYILLSILIMSNDLGRLYQLFILHKQASLTIVPPALRLKRFPWVMHGLKLSLIIYMVFYQIKSGRESSEYKGSFYGIYNIDSLYINNQLSPPLLTDTTRWKRFASYGGGTIRIQFMNDSLKSYQYKMDTVVKTLKLIDASDSTSMINFSYSKINSSDYKFGGIHNKDSLRFILKGVDMNEFPLVKTRNKIIW